MLLDRSMLIPAPDCASAPKCFEDDRDWQSQLPAPGNDGASDPWRFQFPDDREADDAA